MFGFGSSVVHVLFEGNEFALFDNGQNPTRIGASRLMRRELAFIRYERQGFLSPKHPRELLVALPTLVAQADGSKAIATIKPMCPVETIGARLSRHDADSSLLVRALMLIRF